MKKLIFTALSALTVGSAFAQQLVDNTKEKKHISLTPAAPMKHSSYGKATISDWYSPLDWASSAGASATLENFVNFLMPDSLAKFIDEGDTVRRSYKIGVGMVVDPKDDNIDLSQNPGIKLNKWAGYTLDSIGIVGLYVKNVHFKDDGQGNQIPVRDTLIFNYYIVQGGGITKGTLTGTPTPVFATVGWNTATRRPINFIGTQKYVLTDDDTTSVSNNNGQFENAWGVKAINIGVEGNITVPSKGVSDNLIAYTVTFKPGHDYDTSSIMIYQRDPSLFPPTATRVNYFGYRFFSNSAARESQVIQTKFYNNSLFADKLTGYYPSGTINNGWVGFLPGNAYFENQYLQSDVLLTSSNVGLKDIKNDNFAMTNVYPNPANVNGTAVMGFNLKSASSVNVSIFNITGQLIKNVINKNFSAGEHAEEFDLSGLQPGIYMVNMTVNGVSQTKKLTITE
jgi:hypothetical protein